MILKWLTCCPLLPYSFSTSTWCSCSSHLSVDRCLRICSLVFSGISSTHLSSITASVMSLMLCTSGVSPVSFLTVLTSLPNAISSSSSSASRCSQLSIMFLHATVCFVILHCMLLLIGLSPILPTYSKVCFRSSIDLTLTHFLSLLQWLPLSCTIQYLGNTVLTTFFIRNFVDLIDHHWQSMQLFFYAGFSPALGVQKSVMILHFTNFLTNHKRTLTRYILSEVFLNDSVSVIVKV